jgi:hypothetical protein
VCQDLDAGLDVLKNIQKALGMQHGVEVFGRAGLIGHHGYVATPINIQAAIDLYRLQGYVAMLSIAP